MDLYEDANMAELDRENYVDLCRMMDDPELDGIVIDEEVGIFAPHVDFSDIQFVRITEAMLVGEEVPF